MNPHPTRIIDAHIGARPMMKGEGGGGVSTLHWGTPPNTHPPIECDARSKSSLSKRFHRVCQSVALRDDEAIMYRIECGARFLMNQFNYRRTHMPDMCRELHARAHAPQSA